MAARAGAVAAVVAGACWVLKGGAILVTGDQPPGVFEASFLLFPLALGGLYARLGGRGGRTARVGVGLAVVAGLSAALLGLALLFGPESWEPTEAAATILTPLFALAGLGTIVGLLLLGISVRRAQALGPRWSVLPLALGVSVFPLMIVGGALEAVHERLLEVPLVLLGLGWIGLGVALAREDTSQPSPR